MMPSTAVVAALIAALVSGCASMSVSGAAEPPGSSNLRPAWACGPGEQAMEADSDGWFETEQLAENAARNELLKALAKYAGVHVLAYQSSFCKSVQEQGLLVEGCEGLVASILTADSFVRLTSISRPPWVRQQERRAADGTAAREFRVGVHTCFTDDDLRSQYFDAARAALPSPSRGKLVGGSPSRGEDGPGERLCGTFEASDENTNGERARALLRQKAYQDFLERLPRSVVSARVDAAGSGMDKAVFAEMSRVAASGVLYGLDVTNDTCTLDGAKKIVCRAQVCARVQFFDARGSRPTFDLHVRPEVQDGDRPDLRIKLPGGEPKPLYVYVFFEDEAGDWRLEFPNRSVVSDRPEPFAPGKTYAYPADFVERDRRIEAMEVLAAVPPGRHQCLDIVHVFVSRVPVEVDPAEPTRDAQGNETYETYSRDVVDSLLKALTQAPPGEWTWQSKAFMTTRSRHRHDGGR